MIKIETEHSITELGKRNNNEDFCAFIPGLTYIVCDGVGGSEKGEIASNSVVKTFAEDYSKHPNADVAIVLRNAEKNLTDYINENPSALGMATTLTFCQIKNEGVLVAWVGDSRVYQFRNGDIIFSTTDHSWVNEAIQSGIITAEEGVNHPKSNVITRAVQGNHKPTQADSILLTDIKKGDFFMLCSDGVLESWNDNDLKALFSTHNQTDKLTENIKAECSKNSRDNFTAIVFKIKEANIINTVSAKIISPSQTNESNLVTNQTLTKNKKSISGFLKMRIPIGLVLIIAVLAVILFFKLSPKTKKPDDKKVTKTENSNNNASKIDQNKIEKINNDKPKKESFQAEPEQNKTEENNEKLEINTPEKIEGQTEENKVNVEKRNEDKEKPDKERGKKVEEKQTKTKTGVSNNSNQNPK